MNTPTWSLVNEALSEAIVGNEDEALIFLACFLGWSQLSLDNMLSDCDAQTCRDLMRAGARLKDQAARYVQIWERREADRRIGVLFR